ncbi:hypothetical protein WR25_11668 [Diploscapter pachys]|uniref:Uncharacterized protein n=1 Tax=Diploscapter pachys TaxID=2018661 RepID=A0A2A2M4S7_9BILA|nr:hypothetical protein WR25_11668 [Diploscapter pachys]
MPRLRASQTSHDPISAAIVVPTTGTRSSNTSMPTLRLVPGSVNSPSITRSIASRRMRTEAASRPVGKVAISGRMSMGRGRRGVPVQRVPGARVRAPLPQPQRDQRPAQRPRDRDEGGVDRQRGIGQPDQPGAIGHRRCIAGGDQCRTGLVPARRARGGEIPARAVIGRDLIDEAQFGGGGHRDTFRRDPDRIERRGHLTIK